MRNRLLWLVPSVAVASALHNPAQAQDNHGTFEQQLACTPDVFRLCSSEIPDANRIVVCLKQKVAQLDGACKAVFEAQDSAPQPPARPNGPSH
jgi:hypothetical protein